MLLVTGPQAAGKTTVARVLAERFERGVHLEGVAFRRFIVAGREEMTPDPSEEAMRQLRLRYRLAANAATAYADEGFTVVVDDVVAGPMLAEVVAMLGIPASDAIVLMPSPEAIVVREEGRAAKGYGGWSVDQLYQLFEVGTPRIGAWLDTSDLTPEETVEGILRRLAQG